MSPYDSTVEKGDIMKIRDWAVGLGLLFSVCLFGCSREEAGQEDGQGDRQFIVQTDYLTGATYRVPNPDYDYGPIISPPPPQKASLYDQYPDVNQTELMKAVRAEDIQQVQHLLESGENPNIKVYADLTVLDFALSIDRPDIVEILISSGAQ